MSETARCHCGAIAYRVSEAKRHRVCKSADEKVRGIFGRPDRSNVWWIRYTDSAGRYKREKVGRRSDALTLYQTRKTDARRGVKLPDNLRHRGKTFQQLADAILVHVEQRGYKDTRNVASRLKKLCDHFGNLEADRILPEHTTAWLPKHTSTPATANRYKATISLYFREGTQRQGAVEPGPHGRGATRIE